jgi:hypothetical protein
MDRKSVMNAPAATDFMFQITAQEWPIQRSQFATLDAAPAGRAANPIPTVRPEQGTELVEVPVSKGLR